MILLVTPKLVNRFQWLESPSELSFHSACRKWRGRFTNGGRRVYPDSLNVTLFLICETCWRRYNARIHLPSLWRAYVQVYPVSRADRGRAGWSVSVSTAFGPGHDLSQLDGGRRRLDHPRFQHRHPALEG